MKFKISDLAEIKVSDCSIKHLDEEYGTFLQRVISKGKFYVQLSIVIHNVPLYISLIKNAYEFYHSFIQIIQILFIT